MSDHRTDWWGVFRGTDCSPREVGWCESCGEVYEGDGVHSYPPYITTLTDRELCDLSERMAGGKWVLADVHDARDILKELAARLRRKNEDEEP